jgi:hypothetical protein
MLMGANPINRIDPLGLYDGESLEKQTDGPDGDQPTRIEKNGAVWDWTESEGKWVQSTQKATPDNAFNENPPVNNYSTPEITATAKKTGFFSTMQSWQNFNNSSGYYGVPQFGSSIFYEIGRGFFNTPQQLAGFFGYNNNEYIYDINGDVLTGGERRDAVQNGFVEVASAVLPVPKGTRNVDEAVEVIAKVINKADGYLDDGKAISNAVEAAKTSSIFSQITPKITKQMGRRGWTKELIHQTVNNPHATRAATNRATGNVATAYFQKNGSYIVKDNITNEVIQISNRLDPNWIPDATIINPFIPK